MRNGTGRVLGVILLGILAVLSAVIIPVAQWYQRTFDIGIQTLLYTLAMPTEGTGKSVIQAIVSSCLPAVLVTLLLYALFAELTLHRLFPVYLDVALPRWNRRFTLNVGRALRHLVTVGICATFVGSLVFAYRVIDLRGFLDARSQSTTIYEDYYVDPHSVTITAPDGREKNLIWIYLESMETTYASRELGGSQPENYIPRLTQLAEENLSFSNTRGLGGFYAGTGTDWTVGALFASSSGLPFAFPIVHNTAVDSFASGAVTLGQLLRERGYTNEFLCGSDAAFGGRDLLFQQHGDYEIYDYFTAIRNGYIPEDYYVWWGLEDYILYEIAKDELTRLSGSGEPFNLTMLTVDTHHTGGYVCPVCGNDYADPTANVVACADRQVYEFVRWCQEQPFYEDTVIVITGDHPRMDICLMEDLSSERTVYDCILNAVPTGEDRRSERQFATVDLFPTVLSAMGYRIEGDRLGLGTNLFSALPTLGEQMGIEAMYAEFTKYSAYYIHTFS